MAFKDKSGKNFNSKFRSNRSDRENAVDEGMKSEKPKGNRAQANAIEAKGTKTPATGAGDDGGPVNASAAGTMPAKAKEVHITHDHVNGVHHVSAMMEDGTTQDSDHTTPEEAHFQGAMAAGASEGNYPAQHEPPKSDGSEPDEDDDYDVPGLD